MKNELESLKKKAESLVLSENSERKNIKLSVCILHLKGLPLTLFINYCFYNYTLSYKLHIRTPLYICNKSFRNKGIHHKF